MISDSEKVQEYLDQLRKLRERFGIRADFLPADLALTGLVDDLLGASSAAIALIEESTTAVYPLARTAFEAAQRIVVLATDDDYLQLGTRAWLYYQRKDASVLRKTEPETADRWLETVVSQMRDMWMPHNSEAEALLHGETARLKEKKHGPDNFMRQDLAQIVQDRYPRVFKWSGVSVPEMRNLNRGIYAALSRESHARLRVEAAALTISSGGIVEVIPPKIDQAAKRRTLLRCLECSLAEAVGALSYFVDARDRADAERFRRATSRDVREHLPPGFKPDLGSHLAQSGGRRTTFHFLDVPIAKLAVLPEGIACWSAGIVLSDHEYAATFDLPEVMLGDLAAAIGLSLALLRPTGEIRKHTLEGPPRVNVACTLGDVQRNAKEAFVPLIVSRVVASGDRGRA